LGEVGNLRLLAEVEEDDGIDVDEEVQKEKIPEIIINRDNPLLYKELLKIESDYLAKLKEKYGEKKNLSNSENNNAKVEDNKTDQSKETEEIIGTLNKKPILMNNLITPIEISLESFKITKDIPNITSDEKLYKNSKDILSKDDITNKGEYFIDYTQTDDGSTLFIPTFNYNKNKNYFQKFLSKSITPN
jgi:hypothetical protein